MNRDRIASKIILTLIIILSIQASAIPWQAIFSTPKIPKTEAAGSGSTRTKTVEFVIGQFSGNGSTGRSSNTNNTSSIATVRLAETNVSIKNAYIEYEFQFAAQSAITVNSSTLSFDACVVSCTPDAWSGSGRVATTDSSVLEYSSGESNVVRMYLDVTSETQLAAYTGSASGSLSVQAGYRFRTATTQSTHFANASAKLVMTYTYNDSSAELTNTIIYPLESTASGDSGTKRDYTPSGCTLSSNCPTFSYNMYLPDLSASSSRLSQWFYVGGVSRANSAVDQNFFVQIPSGGTSTFVLEQALSDNTGGYYWYFGSSTGVTGFLENATQTLEVQHSGTPSDMALIGGEVFETYRASSSAATKIKTVRYSLGEINRISDLNKATASVAVYLPEDGVSIKKAWIRLTTSFEGVILGRDMYVTTKVGGGSESASTTYLVSCGTQCIANDMKIFHVIPSSTYTTLGAASATSSVNVEVSTQWAGEAQGGTSGELLITYAYTGEGNAYQTTHSIFAAQQNSLPSATSSNSGVDPVLKDTTGSTVIRSAFLEANALNSESDGVPLGDTAIGANMATSSCSVSVTSDRRTDNENARFLLHKDVTSILSASDSQTYEVCYSIVGTTAKFGGTLVYTYQMNLPYLRQTGFHWRDDDKPDKIVTSTIDSGGSVGSFNALALSSSGIPTIAYIDATNARLKIAYCGNTECTSGNTTSSPAPNTATFSTNVDLQLNSSGYPRVSFGNNPSENLIFLTCGNADCTSGISTSSLGTGFGRYSSMQLDSSGYPVIFSYANGTSQSFLSYCGDDNCSSVSNSSTLPAEFKIYQSFDLTSGNLPVLAYYFFSAGTKLVLCNDSTCTSSSTKVIDTSGSFDYISVIVDSNDVPTLLYRNSSGRLILYRCANSSCSSGSSSTVSQSGTWLSMALDSNVNPVFSFQSGSDLRLGICADNSCSASTTDTMSVDTGSVGSYSSIKLDSNDNPVISYYDSGNADLRLAKVYLASSLTSGAPNTTYSSAQSGSTYRLRLGVENTGQGTASTTFQLEFGLNTGGNCSAIGSWTKVGGPSDSTAFIMASSSNLTNGSSTLNIPLAKGGVASTTVNSFVSGVVANTTSTTAGVSIASSSFTELEFAIKPTGNATTSNPYCFRVTQSGTEIGTYASYPQIQLSNNAAPSASSLVVNNSNPIILTANTTTTVPVSFQVTDNNGCSDVFSSGNISVLLYRSSIGSSSCNTTQNNRYCYKVTTSTHNCSGMNNSANATSTFYVYYFADATDASSSYVAQNWLATVIATDASNATGSADSSGVELNTLVAIDVTTSSIDYGTVNAGSNTGATNQIATTTNAGNSSTTLQLSAQETLTYGSNVITTSSQRYATSSFTYPGASVALSDSATTVSGFILTSPTSTTKVSGPTFWGVAVPGGNPTGTYTGVTTFGALFQP